MLVSIKALRGLSVVAGDGVIGRLRTLYFDDDDWSVRGLSVSAAGAASARPEWRVPPEMVRHFDPAARRIELGATRRQLEQAGDAGLDTVTDRLPCSSVETLDSLVLATDGAIGHLDDLLLDTGLGQIRHAVVDTHKWRPDRLVLIRTAWLHDIDAAQRTVRVMVSGPVVKACPRYAPAPQPAAGRAAQREPPAPELAATSVRLQST